MTSASDDQTNTLSNINILTFNCKNIQTCEPVLSDIFSVADVILLQEHWLFDCNLKKLQELSPNWMARGKAVDSQNPISPAQLPRGYGGVAVLWKKDNDHCVSALEDGGNRIQAIRLSSRPTDIIVLSIYMPCRGNKNSDEDLADTVDQLREILLKYSPTCNILIGGDLNVDIQNKECSDRRHNILDEFMEEFKLQATNVGPTFTHANGTDVSQLDYFLFEKSPKSNLNLRLFQKKELGSSVSDHYPVQCTLTLTVNRKQVKKITQRRKSVAWDKIDKDLYLALEESAIASISSTSQATKADLELLTTKANDVLLRASELSCPTPGNKRKSSLPKIRDWSPTLSKAMKQNKAAFFEWKNQGRPTDSDNQYVLARKEAKKEFRRICRVESALKRTRNKEEIMRARRSDSKLFYKLVANQRSDGKSCLNELQVNGSIYSDNIVEGWQDHFRRLAISTNQVTELQSPITTEEEIDIIQEITGLSEENLQQVTPTELEKAIKQLNTGKSPDVYGITAEHLVNAGPNLKTFLIQLLNKFLNLKIVPECLKKGKVMPVYKKKGSKMDAKNYRGITVLPVLCKLLEVIIQTRLRPIADRQQNPQQRGFTKHASPMNCALIIEEFLNECAEKKLPVHIAFLDAKSAFDVVDHNILLRKLYHLGIDGPLWTLVKNLHQEATSSVSWQGETSEPFPIQQGVRQGGILSTDLYKIYINDLLDRMSDTQLGAKIGPITCGAPTCADDVALVSCNPFELQLMIDMAVLYSKEHKYQLQPAKSVVLTINHSRRKKKTLEQTFTMGDSPMPIVEKATHLGIPRTESRSETIKVAVEENIKKARRTLYSLMSSGLHGKNGLDPVTSVHLLKTFVLPVLTFGLEILLPKGKELNNLEVFQRKTVKQVLSLPVTTPDPAVFVLTGLLPIEAVLHLKTLTQYLNICIQDDSSIERQLATRQLATKDTSSTSWFIEVKKLLLKYNLPSPDNILCMVQTDIIQTKKRVKSAVHQYWQQHIVFQTTLYSSLKQLNCQLYQVGKCHALLHSRDSSQTEVKRIPIKLMLVTGTYILQTNRAAFNQNKINPECLLCRSESETIQHFLLDCEKLAHKRSMILPSVASLVPTLYGTPFDSLPDTEKVAVLLDCTKLIPSWRQSYIKKVVELEYQIRRLCFSLHNERMEQLASVK